MSFVKQFINNDKPYSLLTGLAAGLYPVLFYYSNNSTLVSSWDHFWFFLGIFIVLPVVVCYVGYRVFGIAALARWQKYILPFLNVFIFLFLLKTCLYAGIQKKISMAILITAAMVALTLYKHYKKWVFIQLLLAVMGAATALYTFIGQMRFSDEWQNTGDAIVDIQLKKKPNIYLIQPDGYVNFSEQKKGYYKIPENPLEGFLTQRGFTHHDSFRANYASTLSTNSSLFTMTHHYYNRGVSFSEAIDAREVIMGENNVMRILKKNGYQTYFLSEAPYFLINRPKVAYDYTNFDRSEIGYMGTGFNLKKKVMDSLVPQLKRKTEAPKFFFIEFFNPGHIQNKPATSDGADGEREKWMESLRQANTTIEQMVEAILQEDPNALIMIMADHGGFVGFNYTNEIYTKTEDRDLIYSIFSSQFSIRWPQGMEPRDKLPFESPVNVFRILFSELGERHEFLQGMQPNESFVIIDHEAPKGIYKYIGDNGRIVFERVTQ